MPPPWCAKYSGSLTPEDRIAMMYRAAGSTMLSGGTKAQESGDKIVR
jgi:hypothetical protein